MYTTRESCSFGEGVIDKLHLSVEIGDKEEIEQLIDVLQKYFKRDCKEALYNFQKYTFPNVFRFKPLENGYENFYSNIGVRHIYVGFHLHLDTYLNMVCKICGISLTDYCEYCGEDIKTCECTKETKDIDKFILENV